MKKYQFELTAQTPAKLAEEFIVKSIWHKNFLAGSDLMAERELAEVIGVTRTTLREVLQRLARDGWLKIQHGKPTRVNDIWQTAGTNIIPTLLSLDEKLFPVILSNFLTLRKDLANYYIPEAINCFNKQARQVFVDLRIPDVTENAEIFAEFDYMLYHDLAFVANKPVYGLIINSFRDIYLQVAKFFFSHRQSRAIAQDFYLALKQCCEKQDHLAVQQLLRENQECNFKIWKHLLGDASLDVFKKFMT